MKPPFFTSHLERRLWGWALAAIIAIYSTLGPARVLADGLREQNLLEVAILGVLALILIGVLIGWAKKRPGWREIGVGLGVAVAFLMIGVRIESWEERTHLIEYGIVAAIIHQALLERSRKGRLVWSPAALAVILTTFFGTLDEVIQAFIPARVFDPLDIFFNFFAGFMVIAARLALAPQKQPGWRVWFLWLMACSIGWGWGVYWGWFDGTEPKTLVVSPTLLLAGYLGLVTGGIAMGVLQWLILRSHVERASRWLLATCTSLALTGLVMLGAEMLEIDLGWKIGISFYGVFLAVLGWLVLRGQVAKAGWWVVACTLGWGAGMPAGDVAGPPALGAVFGVVTATTLVWLLRQNPTKDTAAENAS